MKIITEEADVMKALMSSALTWARPVSGMRTCIVADSLMTPPTTVTGEDNAASEHRRNVSVGRLDSGSSHARRDVVIRRLCRSGLLKSGQATTPSVHETLIVF